MELVRLSTQDIRKGAVITDSRVVAEHFKKKHGIVLRSIENLIKQNCDVKKMFELSGYKSQRGRIEKEYLITRDGFMLLVMGFTGSEALKWKLEFIKAFNFMEKEQLYRNESRNNTKIIRKNLTDSINLFVDSESDFKKWAYSTYTKLIYKKVLGKTVKKIKLERDIPKNKNLRDYLTVEELEKVQDLESKIATYIEFNNTSNKTDKEIYAEVKAHIEK